MMFDPNAVQPLPLAAADRFKASWDVHNVVLTVGYPRVTMDNGIMGQGDAWLIALSLSPGTVKQLRDLTSELVDRYERAHGVIPVPYRTVAEVGEQTNVVSLGAAPRD